jgi:hypothetical protein
MQELWLQFVELLASYSPTLATRFLPGVDEAHIFHAEQRLGVTFSEEVHTFSHPRNGSGGPLFGSWTFLSLNELCDDWSAYALSSSTEEGIRALGRNVHIIAMC